MNIKNKIWLLIPIFGAICFVVLYIVSTFLYPGGSQVNTKSEGFSWANNYWCNLLYKNAVNGKKNPARPFALTGMIILSSTISFFWFLFPVQIKTTKYRRIIIQVSGSLSMIFAVFLYTDIHDEMINTAGFFGAIAFIGTFIGLYQIKWYGLFILGIINLILLLLNSFIYHIENLIVYLLIIQKISFATFLIWICCIDLIFFLSNNSIKYENKFLTKKTSKH